MKKLVVLLGALALVACGGGSGGSGSGGDGTDGTDGTDGVDGTDGTDGIDVPPGDDNLVPLSSAVGPKYSIFQSVAVTGGHAYACTGAHGMQVAKIGPNGALSLVVTEGALPDAKGCRDVVAAPDGAVFATGQSSGGSFIAQIGPPPGDGTLAILGSVPIGDALVESISATQTHVLAAMGEAGIRIYGRNDGALAEVGRLDAGFDRALGVAPWGESRAVVANGQSGLVVVDVTEPTSPVVLDGFDGYGTSRRVAVDGDLAYVASVSSVAIYDLSSSKPCCPPLGGWPTHASAVELAVHDGLLYVANMDDLCVVDVSTPSDPMLLGSDRIPVEAGNPHVVDVSLDGEVAVAAEWDAIWAYTYVDGREAPDIHLSKMALDFGLTSTKKGKGIIIQNLGQKELLVAEAKVSNDLFSVDAEDAKKVGPGKKDGFLQVNFDPQGSTEPAEAILTLVTNDPDESEVQIPLKANSIQGVQVGVPFDNEGEMTYLDVETGNQVTVKGEHPGVVVMLAYFATW